MISVLIQVPGYELMNYICNIVSCFSVFFFFLLVSRANVLVNVPHKTPIELFRDFIQYCLFFVLMKILGDHLKKR